MEVGQGGTALLSHSSALLTPPQAREVHLQLVQYAGVGARGDLLLWVGGLAAGRTRGGRHRGLVDKGLEFESLITPGARLVESVLAHLARHATGPYYGTSWPLCLPILGWRALPLLLYRTGEAGTLR